MAPSSVSATHQNLGTKKRLEPLKGPTKGYSEETRSSHKFFSAVNISGLVLCQQVLGTMPMVKLCKTQVQTFQKIPSSSSSSEDEISRHTPMAERKKPFGPTTSSGIWQIWFVIGKDSVAIVFA